MDAELMTTSGEEPRVVIVRREGETVLKHVREGSTPRWDHELRQWLQAFAVLAIPVVVGTIGACTTSATATMSTSQEYVAVATQVLREQGTASRSQEALRGWAAEVLAHYSPVEIPERVLADLRSGVTSLSGIDQNFIVIWEDLNGGDGWVALHVARHAGKSLFELEAQTRYDGLGLNEEAERMLLGVLNRARKQSRSIDELRACEDVEAIGALFPRPDSR